MKKIYSLYYDDLNNELHEWYYLEDERIYARCSWYFSYIVRDHYNIFDNIRTQTEGFFLSPEELGLTFILSMEVDTDTNEWKYVE